GSARAPSHPVRRAPPAPPRRACAVGGLPGGGDAGGSAPRTQPPSWDPNPGGDPGGSAPRMCAVGCALDEVSSPAPARRPDPRDIVRSPDGTQVAHSRSAGRKGGKPMLRYGDGSPFPFDDAFLDLLVDAVDACTTMLAAT